MMKKTFPWSQQTVLPYIKKCNFGNKKAMISFKMEIIVPEKI